MTSGAVAPARGWGPERTVVPGGALGRFVRTRRVHGALVLLLALVALGCTRAAQTTGPGPGSTTTPRRADGEFGSLGRVCGPGRARASTAVGVGPSEIRVGTIADVGFVGRPGLHREFFDVADAFAAWCNAAGGIDGRRLRVDRLDAKVVEYRPRILEACGRDLALVGGGGAFDDQGVRDRLSCLLPDFPVFVASEAARGSDLSIEVGPTPLDSYPAGDLRWLAARYPRARSHVGAITAAYPAGIVNQTQAVAGARRAGMTLVWEGQYNAIGEPTWVPIAQALKSRGVRGLIWTGEPQNLARLERALHDIGHDLDWVRADPNHYERDFITAGGGATGATVMRSDIVAFEEARRGTPTHRYLEIVDRYAPRGRTRTYLGVQAFSAWLLFARAAAECGDGLTRGCLVREAQRIGGTAWTGGGLHAPVDVAGGRASPCYRIIEATHRGFRSLAPLDPGPGGFDCDPANVAAVPGLGSRGLTLAAVGRSPADLG